jgi:hypothetical protein
MKRRCGASRLLELFWLDSNSSRLFCCVILSAAKDLDGRSDGRRQLRSKLTKDRLVTLGGISLDSKITNRGRDLKRVKLRYATGLMLLLALTISIASCGGSNNNPRPCRNPFVISQCANSAAVGGTGMPSSPYAPRY